MGPGKGGGGRRRDPGTGVCIYVPPMGADVLAIKAGRDERVQAPAPLPAGTTGGLQQ